MKRSTYTLEDLLQRNSAWAANMASDTPSFFGESAQGQQPNYLWIGCADSRVPPNRLLNLPPGEVFVHRNIANQIPPNDLNSQSVLLYAIEVLFVKHIIVCGHTGCGGMHAATDDRDHGSIDEWLKPVKKIARANQDELATIADEHDRLNRLAELNVIEQVNSLSTNPVICNAWANQQSLAVHGWMYDLGSGRLRDLNVSRTGG